MSGPYETISEVDKIIIGDVVVEKRYLPKR